MPKLNDTQTLLLGHASRDEAGSFHPLPASHAKGGARVSEALAQLVKASLAEERDAATASQTYREDGDLRFGLYVTPAGLEAIGIEPEGNEQKPREGAAPTDAPARQTKSASVLALLLRPEGATLAELIAATGWLPHTTRAALTGLRKKGHTIVKAKRDGATCYQVVAA